mgnify:FL=1
MSSPDAPGSAGFGELRWVEVCDSTSTLVRSLIAELPPHNAPRAVAVADAQSAGRGRLDRRWEAAAGSALMLSVAHEAPSDPEVLGALPLAMGLAAVEAIATTVGAMPGLKWPNDLLVEDGDPDGWKKVGGILGESFDDPRPVAVGRVAVLGIGINTGWDALRSDLPEATSLNLVTGVEVDRRELATALLARYRSWWQRLLDGDRAGFRAALEGASLTIGRRVRVELPTSEMTGVAEAITASGALVIVEDGGARREVTVGDVVHLRPLDDPQK